MINYRIIFFPNIFRLKLNKIKKKTIVSQCNAHNVN
jgi:hypothetical protein